MKVNKMFFCLTMAVALVLGTTGCSSDAPNSETDIPIDDDGLVSTVVFTPQNADSDVFQFFTSELSLDDNGKLAYWNGSIEPYMCRAINSYGDLSSFYIGNKELPKIDFSKQTLVIGWQYITMPVTSIDFVEMDKDVDRYVLNVYATHHAEQDGLTSYVLQPFWALFPKMSDAPVQARMVINQVVGSSKDSISYDDVKGEWELTETVGGSNDLVKLSFREDGTLTITHVNGEGTVWYYLFAEEGQIINKDLKVACPYHSYLRTIAPSQDDNGRSTDYGIAVIGNTMYLQMTHVIVDGGWPKIYVFHR